MVWLVVYEVACKDELLANYHDMIETENNYCYLYALTLQ